MFTPSDSTDRLGVPFVHLEVRIVASLYLYHGFLQLQFKKKYCLEH